jgi:protein-S-isoprenylcysteine O-methyltransferase Ste14
MRLGLVLAVLYTLSWVPLYVFRTETFTAALPTYSGPERLWAWLSRVILTFHMSVACIAMSFVPVVPGWRAISSVVLFAGGIAFWFWGRVLIGPLGLRRLPDEPPPRLRHDGAFRIVRHPLYLAYLVTGAAPLIVADRAFLGVSYALCVIAVVVRSGQEERRLHAQLGAPYEEYCKQVKRLVPFVW